MTIVVFIGMALYALCIGAILMSSNLRQTSESQPKIASSLSRSRVVPDLIDHQPSHSVDINYDGLYVRQGNELLVQQVLFAPRVFYPRARPNKLYTIFMLDPDAPSRIYPLLAPLLHYMVINAPHADSLAGETLVPYLSPSPPPATSYHRYVFLVYEQIGRIEPEPMLPLLSRLRFTLENFSHRSALSGPVACNFFISRFTLNRMHPSQTISGR